MVARNATRPVKAGPSVVSGAKHLADPRTETVRADHEVGGVFCDRIALRPFDGRARRLWL